MWGPRYRDVTRGSISYTVSTDNYHERGKDRVQIQNKAWRSPPVSKQQRITAQGTNVRGHRGQRLQITKEARGKSSLVCQLEKMDKQTTKPCRQRKDEPVWHRAERILTKGKEVRGESDTKHLKPSHKTCRCTTPQWHGGDSPSQWGQKSGVEGGRLHQVVNVGSL